MKILIVDDYPTVVDFFVQVAETLGAGTPETAEIGEEAMPRMSNVISMI